MIGVGAWEPLLYIRLILPPDSLTTYPLLGTLRSIKDWSNQQLLYLILILACLAGMVVSLLFGPGKAAPEITPITIGLGFVLLLCEYVYAREIVRRKGRAITPGWVVGTIIILSVGLIPEGLIIWIASVLWAIVLPMVAIYILVLLYVLAVTAKRHTNK